MKNDYIIYIDLGFGSSLSTMSIFHKNDFGAIEVVDTAVVEYDLFNKDDPPSAYIPKSSGIQMFVDLIGRYNFSCNIAYDNNGDSKSIALLSRFLNDVNDNFLQKLLAISYLKP